MTGRLRIALVHPYPFTEVRRGGERYVWDLAAYLGEQGHDVDVLTGTTDRPGVTVAGNVTFHRVAHRAAPALRRAHVGPEETFALSVIRACASRRFDVVHAFTPPAALAARACGLPVVYTSLGAPNREWLRTQPRITRPLFWAAVRSASEVTALSGWAAEQVQSATGRLPVILSPGVRLDLFPTKATVANGPPVVLFASDASVPAKRLDLVLDAVACLPGVRLRLGGPGAPAWAFEKLGRRVAAVRDRVELLGAGELSDLPARYRDAAVTVLASAGEAFGLVLVESLASGTPVVCADAGGPREIVDDAAVGRRFIPDDPSDLARALGEAIELAGDPDTPARCAAHAADWGWVERVGPAHEELYVRVRRGGPGGRGWRR